jgi:hypothetical protein
MWWSLAMLGVIAWQVPKIIKAKRELTPENLARVIEMRPRTEDDVA